MYIPFILRSSFGALAKGTSSSEELILLTDINEGEKSPGPKGEPRKWVWPSSRREGQHSTGPADEAVAAKRVIDLLKTNMNDPRSLAPMRNSR